MNQNLTELVFILDCSGSMYNLTSDTIGGFNRVLNENQKLPGDANVTTILFNSQPKLLHDRLPVKAVQPLTEKEYHAGGMTAMLDAIGMGIDKIAAVQQSVTEEFRAGKVQFVIVTDGMENASREYHRAQVRKMIQMHQEKDGWDFIFLGANIDAEDVADDIGIYRDRAVTAVSDSIGVEAQYNAVCCANRSIRMGRPTRGRDWAEGVEQDRKRRGK